MGEPRLVIVRRGHFATFELLTRTFSGDHSVQVIWDRRMGERRQSTRGPIEGERRTSSDRRRVSPLQWGQHNYMVGNQESS